VGIFPLPSSFPARFRWFGRVGQEGGARKFYGNMIGRLRDFCYLCTQKKADMLLAWLTYNETNSMNTLIPQYFFL